MKPAMIARRWLLLFIGLGGACLFWVGHAWPHRIAPPAFTIDVLQKSGKLSIPARRAGLDNTFETGLMGPPAAVRLRLTPAQLEEDLATLAYALKEGYAGRFSLPEPAWLQFMQELQQLGRAPRCQEVAILCQEIDALFFTHLTDSHLGVRLPARHPGESICSARKAKRMAKRMKPGIGENLNPGPACWQGGVHPLPGGQRVIWVGVSRFLPHTNEQWAGFLPFLKAHLPTASALVIDLRGNGGGDNAVFQQLAAYLYGRPTFPYSATHEIRNTAVAYTLQANSIEQACQEEEARGSGQANELRKYAEAARQKAQLAMTRSGADFVRESAPYTPFEKLTVKDTFFKQPIYLLIDRYSGSSSESAVDLFEAYPHRIVVGENSAGALHFTEVGMFVLPHSGIMILCPTKRRVYEDRRFLETKGIVPDIQVTPGEDGWAVVLAQLGGLQDAWGAGGGLSALQEPVS